MSVVLIGYRGSGKSTVGRKLADKLWHRFVDTDELIVQHAGKSIREIFQDDGEEKFRAIESTVLADVVALTDHVIALGGGAVLREENRTLIKSAGHKVIYLRCQPRELLRRIQGDAHSGQSRPSLTTLGGGIEEVESLLALREPIYRQVADAELDVTDLTPDEAVVYLARMI